MSAKRVNPRNLSGWQRSMALAAQAGRTGQSWRGFTLVELMIVLAIIAIMVLATLPATGGKVDQARIAESIELMKNYKSQIEGYYRIHQVFPVDNATAGLPGPASIIGNYISAVFLVDGALHLRLGNKIRPELHGKFVSLRPIVVPGTPNAPVSWICGGDAVPANMVAVGENRTNVHSSQLPLSCR